MILNKLQEKAVFEIKGNTLVTASPGSGKTRTLVARAMYKLEDLPKFKTIALITYTNAAADEISSRLINQNNVFIGTIHRFCLEFILRPYGWIYKWYKPRIISYEEKEVFFENNLDIELEKNFGQNKFDEIDKIKKDIEGNLDMSVDWNHEISIIEVARRYSEYQESIKVIDFNEILFRSHKIISENEFILKSLASTFYEILVDEFQDTNLFQYEILKKTHNNGTCTFFMVGDKRQQIFSFAGAIENSFGKAKVDFSAEPVELDKAYRSSAKIVSTYTKLFDEHPVIDNSSSENNELDLPVKFIQTKKANYEEIVKEVMEHLVDKCKVELKEISILSTSWYSAFNVSTILRNEYNIVGLGALPHKYISNNSTFSLLKSLAGYYHDQNSRALRKVKRNIELHYLENDLSFSDKASYYKTNELISYTLENDIEKPITQGLEDFSRLFDKLFGIRHSTFTEIIELIKDGEKSIWNIGQYMQTLSGLNGITNNTIHKVKGLEYDIVILNEMNEHKIPHQKYLGKDGNDYVYEDLTEEGIEEGRKLFYVAVSRAKKYLIILHNYYPSMFIDIIN
ncbi:MAG: ATP-dependent helicase [Bacteroidetes bacterium]|jgi:DNA helicase II / ATP-dependent DNA helicase PcrA|nr:ATP-dependent helicase [Bacteroidota bacterium]MBT6687987.1 ATP-dependent helicase [Bacteroidota bacterium]MBT7144948.1 ATP-dependent helicase [Bacteroidota bacterium]MBT7492118.1 ATP-dependent helicase [Bacteroidota bacterium]